MKNKEFVIKSLASYAAKLSLDKKQDVEIIFSFDLFSEDIEFILMYLRKCVFQNSCELELCQGFPFKFPEIWGEYEGQLWTIRLLDIKQWSLSFFEEAFQKAFDYGNKQYIVVDKEIFAKNSNIGKMCCCAISPLDLAVKFYVEHKCFLIQKSPLQISFLFEEEDRCRGLVLHIM